MDARRDARRSARLTPFAVPDQAAGDRCRTRQGHNFAAERAQPDANVFEAADGACAGAAGVRASAS